MDEKSTLSDGVSTYTKDFTTGLKEKKDKNCNNICQPIMLNEIFYEILSDHGEDTKPMLLFGF